MSSYLSVVRIRISEENDIGEAVSLPGYWSRANRLWQKCWTLEPPAEDDRCALALVACD